MTINKRMIPLLLAAIVLLVYLPAIQAPLNPMDDKKIVEWLNNLDFNVIKSVFTVTAGYYYRPLLMTTYVADQLLWGAIPSFMHLENIAIHALNTVLVYFCAEALLSRLGYDGRLLSALAALLFALHPINSEPVIWIAGRSDLLAGFFVFLSLYFLLKGLNQQSITMVVTSFLVLIPGVLCKETALFFIPAAVVISSCYCKWSDLPREDRIPFRREYFFLLLVIPVLYLPVRKLFFHGKDPGSDLIQLFFSHQTISFAERLQALFSGVGFYAKKLVMPLPLNFTIYRIPDHYLYLGIACFVLIILCCVRRDVSNSMFLAGSILLCSALAALILRPAWTPLAERYLYIPSAFFVLGTVAVICRFRAVPKFLPVSSAFVFLILASSSYAIIDRTILWQDNIKLFEDSAAKNPEFPFVKSVLAQLLNEAGRHEEAETIIMTNRAEPDLRNREFLDLQRAALLIEKGRCEEARRVILAKQVRGSQLFYDFQRALVMADEGLLKLAAGRQRIEIFKEIESVLLELHQVTGDPFYWYRLGQLAMHSGNRENAASYFESAYRQAPANAHYRDAAHKLSMRLNTAATLP